MWCDSRASFWPATLQPLGLGHEPKVRVATFNICSRGFCVFDRLGSFFIVKQINAVTFQFKLPSFMPIHLVFHVSLLQFYQMSTIWRRIHDPLPPIEVDGEHEYEVEDILNSKIYNHQLQYLVHWHGYNVNEHIWEPMKNLSNAMEKVHEFHQQYVNKLKSIPCGIHH